MDKLEDYEREHLVSFHNKVKSSDEYSDCSEITLGKHSCEEPDDFYGFSYKEGGVEYHIYFCDGCYRNTGEFDHEIGLYEI